MMKRFRWLLRNGLPQSSKCHSSLGYAPAEIDGTRRRLLLATVGASGFALGQAVRNGHDSSISLPSPESDSGARSFDVVQAGARGDGRSHPVGENFASLSLAQEVYPHARSMDDELNWLIFQGLADKAKEMASSVTVGDSVSVVKHGGPSLIYIPPGVYIMGGGTLQFSAPVCQFYSDSASLIFSGSNVAVWITGYEDMARSAAPLALAGVSLVGDNSSSSTGLLLRGLSVEAPTSMVTVSQVTIQGFERGSVVSENAHQVLLQGSNISRCSVGLMIREAPNSGERISLVGVTISDSRVGLLMQGQSASLKMVDCSLDYCDKLARLEGGRVTILGGHLEGDSDVDHAVEVYGNGTQLQLIGCEIHVGPRERFSWGWSAADVVQGGVSLLSCHIFGASYERWYLVEGPGRVFASNLSRYEKDKRFLISGAVSRMPPLVEGDNSAAFALDQPGTDVTLSALQGGGTGVRMSARAGTALAVTTVSMVCEPGNIIGYHVALVGDSNDGRRFDVTCQLNFLGPSGAVLSSRRRSDALGLGERVEFVDGNVASGVGVCGVSVSFEIAAAPSFAPAFVLETLAVNVF